MAMRVVADAALTQPDGVANAQPLAERTLVRLAIEPGVAHLLVREKPLFRHEKSSFPVGLDAASLEHEPSAAIRTQGLHAPESGDVLDRATDLGVEREVRIFRPRVEHPVHQHDGAMLVPTDRVWLRDSAPTFVRDE